MDRSLRLPGFRLVLSTIVREQQLRLTIQVGSPSLNKSAREHSHSGRSRRPLAYQVRITETACLCR